jgi:hypothetical protein
MYPLPNGNVTHAPVLVHVFFAAFERELLTIVGPSALRLNPSSKAPHCQRVKYATPANDSRQLCVRDTVTMSTYLLRSVGVCKDSRIQFAVASRTAPGETCEAVISMLSLIIGECMKKLLSCKASRISSTRSQWTGSGFSWRPRASTTNDHT